MTLIEIMVVLVLMGIFTAMALPAYQSFVERKRAEVSTNDLVQSLNQVRVLSITQNQTLVICGSTDSIRCSADWSKGWLAHTTTNLTPLVIFQVAEGLSLVNASQRSDNHIRFNPQGGTPTSNGSLLLCTNDANSRLLSRVILNRQGRVRFELADAIAAENGAEDGVTSAGEEETDGSSCP